MAKKQTKSFEDWMKDVDAEIMKICRCVSADLADYLYRDAYDGGLHPATVARHAVKYDRAS